MTQVCPHLLSPQLTIPSYSSTHDRPKDIYHVAFPKDSLKSKVLAYGVYALEIAQTVMTTMTAFHIFAACNDIWIVWFSVPLMSGMGPSTQLIHCSTEESKVAFVAEDSMYVYRTCILSNSLVISGVVYLYVVFFQAVHILSSARP